MNTSLPPAGRLGEKPITQNLFRAWCFIRPDTGEADPCPGPQLENGRIQMISGMEAVRQSIFLLLSTRPGERVMRPEYGCDLYRLVFATNNDMTAGLAMHYVRQALERWEPRLEIIRLDAGPAPDAPEQLNIFLEYRLRVTQQLDQFYFSLDLSGGNP